MAVGAARCSVAALEKDQTRGEQRAANRLKLGERILSRGVPLIARVPQGEQPDGIEEHRLHAALRLVFVVAGRGVGGPGSEALRKDSVGVGEGVRSLTGGGDGFDANFRSVRQHQAAGQLNDSIANCANETHAGKLRGTGRRASRELLCRRSCDDWRQPDRADFAVGERFPDQVVEVGSGGAVRGDHLRHHRQFEAEATLKMVAGDFPRGFEGELGMGG